MNKNEEALRSRDDEYFKKILWSDECKLSVKRQRLCFIHEQRGEKLGKKYLL